MSLPTNGSVMTLNASAANGSFRSADRVISSPPFGSMPVTGGTSTGDGR